MIDNKMREKVFELRNDNLSYQKISKELGISKSSISKILNEAVETKPNQSSEEEHTPLIDPTKSPHDNAYNNIQEFVKQGKKKKDKSYEEIQIIEHLEGLLKRDDNEIRLIEDAAWKKACNDFRIWHENDLEKHQERYRLEANRQIAEKQEILNNKLNEIKELNIFNDELKNKIFQLEDEKDYLTQQLRTGAPLMVVPPHQRRPQGTGRGW